MVVALLYILLYAIYFYRKTFLSFLFISFLSLSFLAKNSSSYQNLARIELELFTLSESGDLRALQNNFLANNTLKRNVERFALCKMS